MSGTKITGLAGGTVKSTDVHVAVDTTDTSMAPSGTDKKYLMSALKTFNNTSVDIVGGTMNNVVIGGTTPAAGTFTTVTGSGIISTTSSGIFGSIRDTALAPTPGVVHNDSAGTFFSNLIVNADITTNTILNEKLAQMPTLTLKGNKTGGTANASDLTVSEVKTMLGISGDDGVKPLTECLCASSGSMSATYDNGTLGVGATLTNAGSQTALVLDGQTVSISDRVLIASQVTQLQNGIYIVTDTGSPSTNWVLTRATDYDQSSEIQNGDFVRITDGTSYGNSTWFQITHADVVMGTTAILFSLISNPRFGLGSMAYQDGNSVGITGGFINGASIGAFTASTGKFTTLEATTSITNSAFGTEGIVHNNSSGLFSSSLIVDADITTNTITNSKLSQVPANTIRGNNTGSTADIINLTPAEVAAMIGGSTTAALTFSQIGFGDPSNLLSGESNFIYNSTDKTLSINRTGAAISDVTAILRLDSSASFFYEPAMTTAQRTAITPSRGGARCFDTDLKQGFAWNETAWVISY